VAAYVEIYQQQVWLPRTLSAKAFGAGRSTERYTCGKQLL